MKIPFSKYSANGNDFIIIDDVPDLVLTSEGVRRICDPASGPGADGVLVCGKTPDADASMRIFNADGGEAEMCGNGLRCLGSYIDNRSMNKKESYSIRTMNHHYEIIRKGKSFAVEMSVQNDITPDLTPFTGFENSFFVNTGVPHLVFLGKNVKSIDIQKAAPFYRHHPMFPRGTNVSFIEIAPGLQTAYVRTYERGVEDETHSCGTGLTASALALSHWFGWKGEIELQTLGGKQTVLLSGKILYWGEVVHCFDGEVSV